jgi:hypothetical protein
MEKEVQNGMCQITAMFTKNQWTQLNKQTDRMRQTKRSSDQANPNTSKPARG